MKIIFFFIFLIIFSSNAYSEIITLRKCDEIERGGKKYSDNEKTTNFSINFQTATVKLSTNKVGNAGIWKIVHFDKESVTAIFTEDTDVARAQLDIDLNFNQVYLTIKFIGENEIRSSLYQCFIPSLKNNVENKAKQKDSIIKSFLKKLY